MSEIDSVKIVDPWSEEGSPAFPDHTEDSSYKGMSLRDYFAAKALIGYLQASAQNGWSAPNEYQVGQAAKNAYIVADAMLTARERS